MNKEILVITGGSYIGGTEIVTLQVLRGLLDNGNRLSCLTSGWNDGLFEQELQKYGIPFQSLKLGWVYFRRPLWTIDTLLHLPTALWKARKFLRREHQLVYATSLRQLYFLRPFIRKPILLHIHEPVKHNAFYQYFIKSLQPQVAAFIAVSQSIRQNLLALGVPDHKIKIVHNGVDPFANEWVPKRTEAKTITFGIVGQIIPRKGHDDVIEALRLLVEEGYSNFKLNIVGKGPENYEIKLKKLIAEKGLDKYVVWRGFQREKAEIYADIQVLLVPTRNEEPFGMVAIEAGYLEIPVIATEAGGLKEIIIHEQSGWLVPPQSPHTLKEIMRRVLNEPGLIPAYGANGRKEVLRRFTASAQLRQIEAIIESIQCK